MPKPPRLHVLIAEDDRATRHYLQNFLEAAGHRVVGTFATGEELVNRARELAKHDEPINCIVVDWQLEKDGIDGLETIQKVKEIKTIPAILVTGEDMEEERKIKAISRGIKYIKKPLNEKREEFLTILTGIQEKLADELEKMYLEAVVGAKKILIDCGLAASDKDAENLIGQLATKNHPLGNKGRNITSYDQAQAIVYCQALLERLAAAVKKTK